ncbi:MAG: TolC family protein [Bacteroidales bacterium]|nr:TolC family protein [Bacteroidales bacterium]
MKKKSIAIWIGIFWISVFFAEGIAQETRKFTLEEAQAFALENNYNIRNAITDVEIAEKKVKENLAIGLPQISAGANYNYYIELPTTIIPAGDFPMFGDSTGGGGNLEFKFGLPHNASWNASLNQLIFSGQYIVGLMASQAYVGLVESNLEKSEIDIKEEIAKAYYPVIILKQNKELFDSTLVSLSKMLYETEEYYKSGFLEDTDVDQIKLLISDMETTIVNIDNQLEIAYNMLKYQMGIPFEMEIEVTDNLDELLDDVNREFLLNSSFDYSNHIDYRLLQGQERMAMLQLKLNRSEYYPTLSGFYSFQQDAQREKFDFTASDKKWFTNQMVGLQLDVPIFSSGNRRFKVQQAQLELEKIKVQDEQLKQGLSLKVKTVKSEFNNAFMIYKNKQLAVDNAEKIYQKTEIKYREGLSTSLNLSQTYNQYLTTQIDYLTSILTLLNKKSELEKELTKAN